MSVTSTSSTFALQITRPHPQSRRPQTVHVVVPSSTEPNPGEAVVLQPEDYATRYASLLNAASDAKFSVQVVPFKVIESAKVGARRTTVGNSQDVSLAFWTSVMHLSVVDVSTKAMGGTDPELEKGRAAAKAEIQVLIRGRWKDLVEDEKRAKDAGVCFPR